MLVTLPAGKVQQVTWAASSAHSPPVTKYLIANLDETGTIYVAPSDADRQQPDFTNSAAVSQLVALQSITVSADQDWYALNPSTGLFGDAFSNVFGGAPIVIDVIPNCEYWAPSPYQQALSLYDQGLMKDSTGQVISTHTSSTATNTSNALSTGVPPNVPNIATASQTFKAPGTYNLHTMGSAGRIWMASVTGAYEANAGYGGGLDNESISIVTTSGLTLSLIELAVTVANQITNDTSVVPWNGLMLAGGDVIQLVVSSPGAGTTLRGSGFVAYSNP